MIGVYIWAIVATALCGFLVYFLIRREQVNMGEINALDNENRIQRQEIKELQDRFRISDEQAQDARESIENEVKSKSDNDLTDTATKLFNRRGGREG